MNMRIHEDDESQERRSSYKKDKRFKTDKQSNYIQQSQRSPPRDTYALRDRDRDRKPRPWREPKPKQEWTPLNRLNSDILKNFKSKPFYYPPKPLLAPPENRPQNKHCSYNETYGHTTDNCFSLKMFIEN